MPDYLSEKDWKDVLKKPKNLGLRAQGTGISEKLRDYESANDKFEQNKSLVTGNGVLKALRDLRSHADKESKEHKAFKEATDYMKDIVVAANTREMEIMQAIALAGAIEIIQDGLERINSYLEKCDTAEDFKNSDTKSLVQSIRGVGASCAKSGVPALVNAGKKSGTLTSNEFLIKVTDNNLSAAKRAVEQWVGEIEDVLENP